MGRRIALVLLTGSVAMASLTTPAHAASAAPLGGITTLSGQGAGAARVSLERAAVLDLADLSGDVGSLDVADGEGLTGFVLEDRSSTSPQRGYAAFRLPSKIGPQAEVAIGYDNVTGVCERCVVPPGNYVIYLVSSGAAAISVSFEGLDGQAAIVASSPVQAVSRHHVEQRDTETTSGLLATRSSTATEELPTPTGRLITINLTYGAGASDMIANPPAPAISGPVAHAEYGLCRYGGLPAVAPMPGCPSGNGQGGIAINRVFDDYGYLLYAFTLFAEPETTLGAYQAVGGRIDTYGHITAFIAPLED